MQRVPDDGRKALDMLMESVAQVSADYYLQPTMPGALAIYEASTEWWKQMRAAVAAIIDARVVELIREAK